MTGEVQVHYQCSGTLIAPDQVLTAAHCVNHVREDSAFKINVFCGYIPTASPKTFAETSLTELSKTFKESFVPKYVAVNPQFDPDRGAQGDNDVTDFAVIGLPRASQIEPLSLFDGNPTTSALPSNALPSNALQCIEAGYGLNANHTREPLQGSLASYVFTKQLSSALEGASNISGLEDATLKTQDDISSWLDLDFQKYDLTKAGKMDEANLLVDKELKFLNDHHTIHSLSMSGDSGGPLLCRSGDRASWKVAGVDSSNGIAITFKQPVARRQDVVPLLNGDGSLHVWAVTNWVVPNPRKATLRVWPRH